MTLFTINAVQHKHVYAASHAVKVSAQTAYHNGVTVTHSLQLAVTFVQAPAAQPQTTPAATPAAQPKATQAATPASAQPQTTPAATPAAQP